MKKVLENIRLGTDVVLDATFVEHPFYPKQKDEK